MKTITENKDKLKAMLDGLEIIKGSNLLNSMIIIGTDMLGSVGYTPEKTGMQCVLNDWMDTKPDDRTHQSYYRKVIADVLGHVKTAQENSVYNV